MARLNKTTGVCSGEQQQCRTLYCGSCADHQRYWSCIKVITNCFRLALTSEELPGAVILGYEQSPIRPNVGKPIQCKTVPTASETCHPVSVHQTSDVDVLPVTAIAHRKIATNTKFSVLIVITLPTRVVTGAVLKCRKPIKLKRNEH